MNKWTQKITAVGLCASLCLGGAGIAFAQTTGKQEQTGVHKIAAASHSLTEASKDETVYVLAGADGSVQKIIVSDWIKNVMGSDVVPDWSDLSEIETVKGEESYTMREDSMRVWDARGGDIYYQGSIDKELPVGITVTYLLDGDVVSAQEIAGRSGRVTIRFDYENRQYEMVEIDGSPEKIYVPFAVLTGMMLDSDTFRNVEVSNGKLLNDGDHTIVVGLAFPGLQENLAISPEEFAIANAVEVTADVTNFSFGMTVTVATNELFAESDETKLAAMDTAVSSLGELSDAMVQLIDGSSALYDGLCTLLDKSTTLVAGIEQLTDGANAVKKGADSVEEGAAQLKTGLSDLSTGLDTLSTGSASLQSGAEQLFQSLLGEATQQIQAAGITVPALTIHNYSEVLNGIMRSSQEAAQTLAPLKESLDRCASFYQGLCAYTNGVDTAAAGAKELSQGATALQEGTTQLNAGTAALYDGVLTLKNGTPALVSGVTQLKDGAMELSEGLKQVYEQGIQKLVALVGGDEGLVTRLKATLEVSQRYQNFAGISDEMEGQVKFIYRTDEITAD